MAVGIAVAVGVTTGAEVAVGLGVGVAVRSGSGVAVGVVVAVGVGSEPQDDIAAIRSATATTATTLPVADKAILHTVLQNEVLTNAWIPG